MWWSALSPTPPRCCTPRHRHPSLDTLAATCPSGTPPSPTLTCRSPHGGKKSRPSPTRISPPRARRPRRRPPRRPPRRRRGWRRCPPSPAAASPRRPKGKRRLWSLVSCRARPQQRALAYSNKTRLVSRATCSVEGLHPLLCRGAHIGETADEHVKQSARKTMYGLHSVCSMDGTDSMHAFNFLN